MEFDERKHEERVRLLHHCDFFFRPPPSFYSALEEAIALAAADRPGHVVEILGDRVPAAELIEEYQLEEFVERAKFPPAEESQSDFDPGVPAGE